MSSNFDVPREDGRTDREYMLEAIKQSGAIRIYRRTSGSFRLASELASQGIVKIRIVQDDEQSSHAEVTLVEGGES